MATDWQVRDRIPDPITHQGRWEIHRIKRGGMGTVYVVYDHESREALAAKTFRDEIFARNPGIANRFGQEALAWINLEIHQNITRADFVQVIEGKPFLFLEYVSGGDLSGWIGTPRLTEDLPQVLRFAIQFCDGMIHASSKGLHVHRDIKPQNCLITQDGTLKVTDFGLAKMRPAFDPKEAQSEIALERGQKLMDEFGLRLTATGTAAGTPPYMAPEQFVGAQLVDVRVDIYSFGVMLFEMTAGRLPFIGRTQEEFARLHRTEEPPPLPTQPTAQHAALSDLIGKCMSKAPSLRFAGFEELRRRFAGLYESLVGKPAPRSITKTQLHAVDSGQRGVSLANLGLYEEALHWFDRALDVNPDNAAALSSKGNALKSLGRLPEAIGCHERAIELLANDAKLWVNKAAVFFDMKRHHDAIACLDRAIELNPLEPLAWINLGNALHATGRAAEAIDSFDHAIGLNPRSADAWTNRGANLAKVGRLDEALECHERASELEPWNALAWYNRGGALLLLKRYEEAVKCLTILLELDPKNLKGWVNKGSALGSLEKYEQAIQCYDRAIELSPDSSASWFNKGTVLAELERYQGAIACFEEAHRLGVAHAQQQIERCRQRSGEKGAAAAEPSEKGSVDAGTWYDHGASLTQSQFWQQAIDCYDRAIELDSTHEKAWCNKGTCLSALGKQEEALDCFQQAVELNPDDDKAWANRAVTLASMGRMEEALVSLDSSLEANPRNGETWKNKAVILKGLGRIRDSLACFERARDLRFPGMDQAIGICRQMLEEG